MENNEIMEKLMQNDVHSENERNASAKESTKWGTPQLPRIRVITAKYKLFIVILAILICILLYIIPGINDDKSNTQNKYDAKKQELVRIDADIRAAKNDMDFLTEIVFNESNVKKCLNGWDAEICDSLPQEWYKTTNQDAQWDAEDESIDIINKYNLAIPLSYLQIHSLYNKKMDVDEKAILKNLNEYLIRHDISGQEKQSVGQILKISIWDPEVLWEKKICNTEGKKKVCDANFFVVPVDVEIEFSTVWDLLDFLYNIEKKIVDKKEDRILYKIQTVSYDIIANDEPQITDISMLAYYYYDKDFWKIDENDKKLKEIDEYEYYSNTSSDTSNSRSTKESDNKKADVNEKKDNTKNDTEVSNDSFFSGLFK